VTLCLEKPNGLLYDQVQRDGTVKGLVMKCDMDLSEIPCPATANLCDHEISVEFDTDSAKIMDGKVGVSYSPFDDDDPSDDDSATQNDGSEDPLVTLFNDLRERTKVIVDMHWNCYCKTRTVCGCGCDPKHDGW
jgi:hypothetical protein